MTPVHFDGHNAVLAKDQPEFRPLPVLRVQGIYGEVISCWHLSFFERCRLLFTGRLWLSQLTFGSLLQPQLPSVREPDAVREAA